MAINFFDSEETRRWAISATRGDYQYSVLVGGESWSGSTLRGAAKSYGGRYRDSRESLLTTLRAHFDVAETVEGRSKAYRLSERWPLDLTPRDAFTASAIAALGLEPACPSDIRVLRAEHVEGRHGSSILLATVYAAGIEGAPKNGPTLRVTEGVYVVARLDKFGKPVVRDTIRKARVSAKQRQREIELVERERVRAINEAAEKARREAAEAASPVLTDADHDTVAEAFA